MKRNIAILVALLLGGYACLRDFGRTFMSSELDTMRSSSEARLDVFHTFETPEGPSCMALPAGSPEFAGAIKSWTNETLRYTDLNSNFTHVHDALRGGSHTLIVNADINASAAVAHTKMATPALLPKAWATLTATCAAGVCAMADSSGVTTVTWNATGVYVVDLSYAPADANFGILVTSHVAGHYCSADVRASGGNNFNIGCYDGAVPALINSQFTFMILDS